MYSDIVGDHVTRPRNVGPLDSATHKGVAGWPGEGAYMILWFEVKEGRILKAAYETYGCFAAIACGSITAQVLTGRTIAQALSLDADDIARLLGGLPAGKEHCSALTIQALKTALEGEQ